MRTVYDVPNVYDQHRQQHVLNENIIEIVLEERS
jgi:hypothetical protein